jgi:hypothetical protein
MYRLQTLIIRYLLDMGISDVRLDVLVTQKFLPTNTAVVSYCVFKTKQIG